MAEPPKYAPALVKLLQGVVYPDDGVWELVLTYEAPIAAYFEQVGIELVVKQGEYAYLSQPRPREGEAELFRLVPSRPLTLYATALLVILREFVLDHENRQQTGAPIITRAQILERLDPLIDDQGSQTSFQKRIDTAIEDAKKLRFLRERADGEFEIRALIKAKISAERIAELLDRIQQARQEQGT